MGYPSLTVLLGSLGLRPGVLVAQAPPQVVGDLDRVATLGDLACLAVKAGVNLRVGIELPLSALSLWIARHAELVRRRPQRDPGQTTGRKPLESRSN